MVNPANELWTALKRVLRYLQCTKELGVCYKNSVGHLNIEAWSDSSWGEDPDDIRSINGHVVFMAGGPFHGNPSSNNQWFCQTLRLNMWTRIPHVAI